MCVLYSACTRHGVLYGLVSAVFVGRGPERSQVAVFLSRDQLTVLPLMFQQHSGYKSLLQQVQSLRLDCAARRM